MSYTINNRSTESLEVEDVSVTLENQAEDRAVITFAVDGSDPLDPIFAADALVYLRRDNVILFSGRCLPRATDLQSNTEGASVTVQGPWGDFAQVIYRQVFTDPLSGVVYASGRTKLSGSLVTIVQTLIQFAISQGAACSMGTIDLPAITVPEFEAVDQPVSSLLQQVLKFVPSAIVLFDYTSLPPVCHVAKQGSSVLQTVSAPGDAANYKARSDLIPASLTLTYERPYQITRRSNLSGNGYTSASESSRLYVGADIIGTVGGVRGAQVSALLKGSKTATIYSHKFATDFQNVAYYQERISNYYPRIGRLFYTTGSNSLTQYSTPIGTIYVPNKAYPYCYTFGFYYHGLDDSNLAFTPSNAWICPDRRDAPGLNGVPDAELLNAAGYNFYRVRAETTWSAALPGSPQFTFVHTFLACNFGGASPIGRTVAVTKDTTSDTLEAMPVGMGAAVMGQWSQLFYEGGVAGDLAAFNWRQRAALVGGVASPVQRVAYSLSSEATQHSFGPPTQLRAADFLALFSPVA